jgi:hypothetical protein
MARLSESAFLDLAKQRWKQAQDADQKQRERERDDLAFYQGQQWSPDQLRARSAQPAAAGGVPLPARPNLVINKIRGQIRQVLNEISGSDIGIELVAADDFGDLSQTPDDPEIELREGLVRRIQRESEAEDARLWAVSRATIAGRGYYGVMTRYLPGKTWDQEVFIERFYNQASVSLDPAHQQPDGSDAEWAFVGNDIRWDEYKARWPKAAKERKNKVIDASDDEFRAYGDDAPGWFSTEGSGDHPTRMCRVVDYWYTERTTRTLCQLADGRAAWKDDLPEGAETTDERDVKEKTIHWAQLDGVQTLDETDWSGPDLPIIKVLGEELHPFDQERREEGMVRPSRDAQVGFNAMVSKWVETIGYAPVPPWQATLEQIQGYEPLYQQANVRPIPVLLYNAVSDAGQPLGPPTRTFVDTPIQALAASVQLFDEAIQSTTNVPESRIGQNTDSRLKSGRAIALLQQQSQQGTSNYSDNFKRSVRYEGQIVNNLLYAIYGRPGRIARIVTGEGESQTVTIGAPTSPQSPDKRFALTKDAKFNVIVKVTKSYDSRRLEESSLIGELMSANPMLMTWFGDLFFKNSDGPGHLEMAERAKVMLDPKIQAMIAQKAQGQEIPPPVMAQMADLHQRLQHAEQVMQAQQRELQNRQADQQTKLQITQMDGQKDIELQRMRNAASIEVAMIAARAKGVLSAHEAADEAIALHQEQLHDALQSEADRQHDAELQIREHAHAAATGMGQQEAASSEADAQRQHEQAMAPPVDSEAEPQPVTS